MADKRRRRHQSGNPARRAAPAPRSAAPAPPRSPARRRFEQASAPVLLRLHASPRWVLPVVMGLALAGGLFLAGPWTWLGALLLALVALVVAWLLALSWPVLEPGGRFGRSLVLLALVGLAALKAAGRL